MGVEFPAPLRDDCVREDLPFVIDEDDLCSVEEDRLPREKKEFSHQKFEISKFEGVSLDSVSRSIGNSNSTSISTLMVVWEKVQKKRGLVLLGSSVLEVWLVSKVKAKPKLVASRPGEALASASEQTCRKI